MLSDENPLAARLQRAEDNTRARMKPADEIVAKFLPLEDEMMRLSIEAGAAPLDVACVFEALTGWAGAIEKTVRAEEYQGSIEWWR